jgi:hypothetical protein
MRLRLRSNGCAKTRSPNPRLLPPLLSLQEVEQKLNRVPCLFHFASSVSVVIERCGLQSAKLQLLHESLDRNIASDLVHGSPQAKKSSKNS